MNDQVNQSEFAQASTNELDELFSQSRRSQPELLDAGFTASVMVKVETEATVHQSYQASSLAARSSLAIDLLAGSVGLAAVVWMVDANEVLTRLVGLIPESIVISPVSVVATVASLSLLSIASWWAVDQR